MHLSRNESWVLLLDFLPKFRVPYLAVFRQHYCEVILIFFFQLDLLAYLIVSMKTKPGEREGMRKPSHPLPPGLSFLGPLCWSSCVNQELYFCKTMPEVGSLKCLTCFFAVVSWDWLERPRCSTSVSRKSRKRTKKTCPWNCTKFWPGNLKFWV